MSSITYIDQPLVVEILPNYVRITVKSGDEVCVRAMPRSLWRRHLETSIRALNSYERAERGKRKIVKFIERGHR